MNNKAKFTKGPWDVIEREVMEDGSVYPFHIIGGHLDYEICQMESDSVAYAYTHDAAWKQSEPSVMVRANAALIAAAPDLYEELHRLDPTNPVLAKARGES